jgi:transposase
MSGKASPITLNVEEKRVLENIANLRTAPYRKVQRARLVLLADKGMTNTAIALEVKLQRSMVVKWRQRFLGERLAGLEDRPRPGKPRQYSDADRLRVIEMACNQKPIGETHWSVRTLAKASGVGRDTVHQILRQANLKPHQVGTFSTSTDPDFAAEVVDVVGLYLHPPENTIVLCVDEKTQVQALDRTQPLLPMRPGQIERQTHDYKRNGTVQLYAALEVQAGHVVPRIEERHRSREFIAFMNQLLRAYPSDELHVILDNVKSHDSKEVKEWHQQARHKRLVFHFFPTYSSWLNLAEVLFSLLQAKALRRGIFTSKQALITAIMNYIQKFNEEGRVFRWTKTADVIISSVNNLTRH